jgi:DNA mismatch endonuclease (patch repair protein)
MMAAIRGRDTRPEMAIRRGLHALGYRYRLQARGIAGRPDLVFRKRRAVIFVNGCFWHGHDCHLFRMPGTRRAFWEAKIRANEERDARVRSELLSSGWRVLEIWECALRGKEALAFAHVMERCTAWLESDMAYLEVRGAQPSDTDTLA